MVYYIEKRVGGTGWGCMAGVGGVGVGHSWRSRGAARRKLDLESLMRDYKIIYLRT